MQSRHLIFILTGNCQNIVEIAVKFTNGNKY